MQKAEATRARLEADARSSQREAAELMQGHTNVARSLLAEELRLLDDEWRIPTTWTETERATTPYYYSQYTAVLNVVARVP